MVAIERLDLRVSFVGGTAAAASGESLLDALHQLLLPGLYLVRMHLEALGRKKLPPVVPIEQKERELYI